MKPLKNAGLLAALVAMFVAGFFAHPLYQSYRQKQVTDPAKAFVAALIAGDDAKAYGLTSTNMHKDQTQAVFISSVGNLKSTNPQYNGETVSVDKTKATYSVLAHNVPADGVGSTTALIQLGLAKQSGSWVVDSVAIQ